MRGPSQFSSKVPGGQARPQSVQLQSTLGTDEDFVMSDPRALGTGYSKITGSGESIDWVQRTGTRAAYLVHTISYQGTRGWGLFCVSLL